MKFKKAMGLPAAIAAVVMGTSFAPMASAEIELGQGLSVTGFVDMSFKYEDIDGASESTQVFAVDQVETNFLYAGSNGVSARVDIEYGDNDTFVEQAFITKKFGDNFSVKAGRFLSYTGWETEEPTGLFQYSGTGYAGDFYGGYQQGVSGMYSSDMFDVMLSVVNDAFDPVENDNESMEIEVGIAVRPVEGLTAKLFFTEDSGNEVELINFWTSYAVSGFTFAFEYNIRDEDAGGEADGYLLMANYASGNFGITGRYHDYSRDSAEGVTVFENSAITIAPSYKVGDNLLLVAEVRADDFGDGDDVTTIALEALFTF